MKNIYLIIQYLTEFFFPNLQKNLLILLLFIVKQEGNYKVALKYYDKCQKNLEFETTLKGEDEENRKEIIVLAHINMAMCHLKLEHYVKVRDHCNKALDLDDKCVKAYFRRGQVRQKIGLPVIGNVKQLQADGLNTYEEV